MSSDEQQLGKLMGYLEGLAPTIIEIRSDVKRILEAQATTEERLNNGNRHFEKIDACIEKTRDDFKGVWAAIRSKADWRFIYPLIVIGFTVMAFLVEHFYRK